MSLSPRPTARIPVNVITPATSPTDDDAMQWTRRIVRWACLNGAAPWNGVIFYGQYGVFDYADPVERDLAHRCTAAIEALMPEVWLCRRAGERLATSLDARLDAYHAALARGDEIPTLRILTFGEDGTVVQATTVHDRSRRAHAPRHDVSRVDDRPTRQPVALESPFASDPPRNLAFVRALIRWGAHRGYAPWAMHAFYTQPGVLDDLVPAERTCGIECGLAVNALMPEVWYCLRPNETMSAGMRLSLEHKTAEVAAGRLTLRIRHLEFTQTGELLAGWDTTPALTAVPVAPHAPTSASPGRCIPAGSAPRR